MPNHLRIETSSIFAILLTLPSMSYAWWGENDTWNIWQNDNGQHQISINSSSYGRGYERPTPYSPFVYSYTPYSNPCYDNSYENRYHETPEESDSYAMPPPKPDEFRQFDQSHYWATPYDMPFPPASFSRQPTEQRVSEMTQEDDTRRQNQSVDYRESVWAYPTAASSEEKKVAKPRERSVWEYPQPSHRQQMPERPASSNSHWSYPSNDKPIEKYEEKRATLPINHLPKEYNRQYPTAPKEVSVPTYTTPTTEDNTWHYPDNTLVPVEPQSFDFQENNSFKHNVNTKQEAPSWQYVDDQGLPPLKQPSNNFTNNQAYKTPQYPDTVPKTADFLLPPLKK